ncbi:nucleolar GTP-binding protein 1 [Caerostris extrusa]|uniref:Nucleolar GTP-binding protein 1 n=1 Tax=Caerostris extrusa TaxID=172846 RepID=A0AAV4RPB4_CAEEX|nr:nucleolar GTP-binding protein 1 [Caerostris extrusa]
MKIESQVKKASTKPKLPRTAKKRTRSVSRLRNEFRELGVDLDENDENHYDDATVGRTVRPVKRMRMDSEGRVRSSSRVPRDDTGVQDLKMKFKAKKLSKIAQRSRNRLCKKGEGDKRIPNMKPKHLYAGKRSLGKTSRR